MPEKDKLSGLYHSGDRNDVRVFALVVLAVGQ